MTSGSGAIHIERLFATTLTVDRPAPSTIDVAGLAAAAATATPDRPVSLWDDATGGTGHERASALVAHVRSLASAATTDVRGRMAANWRIHAAAHACAAGAQPELPVPYDAFWTALFVLDDGYDGPHATGGELVLLDPRLPAAMMEAPAFRLALSEAPQPSAYAPELLVRPATGQLFLYPAWLRVQQRSRASARLRLVVQLALVPPTG